MARWVFLVCVGCATAGEDTDIIPRRKPDSGQPIAIDSGTVADDTGSVVDSATIEDTSSDTGSTESEPPEVGPMTTTLTIDTSECKAITCPSSHPYVVGCKVNVGGASNQLCIVHVAGSTTVTFKEGQSCGAETVKGTVTCSTAMGTGLDTTNCTSNKTKPLYITAIGMCPT